MRLATDIYCKGFFWPLIAKRRLLAGTLRGSACVVCINAREDQLDIHPAWSFRSRESMGEPLFVVALTGSYIEAIDYISHIAGRCYLARGDYLIREYLLDLSPQARGYLGL